MGETQDKLPDTLTPKSPLSASLKAVDKIKMPWGRLYSYLTFLDPVDMLYNTISLGRSEDCDIIIHKNKFHPNHILLISKKHFEITRDEETNIVYIFDYSKNGTYINGNLVGKGKKRIIQNDDVISAGAKNLKLFIYKPLRGEDDNFLPPKLRNKYQISRILGKGACGEVRLAFEKTTCHVYAIKRIIKASFSNSNVDKLNHPLKVHNEVEILRALSHPCVIKMKEIVETEKEMFIVLEYMQGGTLTSRILSIHPLTESDAKLLFYQIALGVQYLHYEGISHRDLKPDNVLLTSDKTETLVKISDFGLSKILDEVSKMDTICGTPHYVAPEIINKHFSEYNKQVDVWSLGVILFYMLSQELPFKGPNRVLETHIINGVYNFNGSAWSGISVDAKDLVKKMLIVNPQKRITINQILAHPWFEKDVAMKYKVSGLLSSYLSDDSDDSIIFDDLPAKKLKVDLELTETTV